METGALCSVAGNAVRVSALRVPVSEGAARTSATVRADPRVCPSGGASNNPKRAPFLSFAEETLAGRRV